MTKTNDKVKELVVKMLKENTGKAMCDSGDYYGRNWQMNQQKDLKAFEAEPAVKWSVYRGERRGKKYAELSYTVSVYHFLTAYLELDEVCEEFNALPVEDWKSDLAYGLSLVGEEWLEEHGAEVKNACNTYNGETDLSQVLQFSEVTISDEEYVLLQIHGGCDVRGGYTDAKLFKLPHYDKDMFLYQQYSLSLITLDNEGNEVIAFDCHGAAGDWVDSEQGSSVSRDDIEEALLSVSDDKIKMYCDFSH